MHRLGDHLGFPRRLTRDKVLEVLSLSFELENSYLLLFSLSFRQLFQAFVLLRLSFVIVFSFASFSFVRLSSVCFSSTSLFSSFRLVLSPFALTFLVLLLIFFPRVKALLPRFVPYVVFCPTNGAKHGTRKTWAWWSCAPRLPLANTIALGLVLCLVHLFHGRDDQHHGCRCLVLVLVGKIRITPHIASGQRPLLGS